VWVHASAVFAAAASSVAPSVTAAEVGIEVLGIRGEALIVKLPVLARDIRDP
jgi:hypothetical protein